MKELAEKVPRWMHTVDACVTCMLKYRVCTNKCIRMVISCLEPNKECVFLIRSQDNVAKIKNKVGSGVPSVA